MLTFVFSPDLLTGGSAGTIYQKYFQTLRDKGGVGKKFDRTSPMGQEIFVALKDIATVEETIVYELRVIAKLSLIWEKIFVHLLDKQERSFNRQTEKNEKEIKAVVNYIHQNYMKRITIQTICDHTKISRSECFLIFARFTQKKPMEVY